ncbi:hypothetical protein Y032_0221g2570 [Ancylostoma ceylanicum]|uniref:Uncharacterized protein n=1 Tax=Ancylostoma ceylanicum TaxID=53326 RepID=A0A016SIY3_9BILA|nr:hypothetical protein Y032_0221g2570 [Ancylostoma ceylanicum]
MAPCVAVAGDCGRRSPTLVTDAVVSCRNPQSIDRCHRWQHRRRPVAKGGECLSPTSAAAAALRHQSMGICVTVDSDGDAGCYTPRGL